MVCESVQVEYQCYLSRAQDRCASEERHLPQVLVQRLDYDLLLPKKLLEREKVSILHRKVPIRIINNNGDVFMLIKIKESISGFNVFRGDEK